MAKFTSLANCPSDPLQHLKTPQTPNLFKICPDVIFLVDVSDIFNFFCSGERKGESGAPGTGGADFLLKIRGGGLRGGEEGVCGEFGGRGAKFFFFRGRNVHQVFQGFY